MNLFMETASVIRDLSIVLATAGIVAIAFSFLRLPVMLGYIFSGLVIGPNISNGIVIQNEATIRQLSELGVIFLMFYIGLEFDLRKLRSLMGPSLLSVVLQSICMCFLGLFIAPLLGWSGLNGFFLGGLLAISSTMITIPILRDSNALQSNYAQWTIGILILEDIVAILLLVVLAGVAVTGRFAWDDVVQVTFFVGIFVVMVFFIGRLLAPWMVRVLDKIGKVDILTIAVIGFVLGIGQLAQQFSLALGAFLAGSILSQTLLAEKIEAVTEPFRNVFSAVFFVTVGMLIQPNLLIAYWKIILLLTALVVIGKIVTCWLGLFLSGQQSKTAFLASVSKAQIGEFSFVIATLGQSFGVTDSGLMAVAVGVSLGTITVVTLLTPFADPIFESFAKRTPKAMQLWGAHYHKFLEILQIRLTKWSLLKLIYKPLGQILVYFFLLNGIVWLASFFTRTISASPICTGHTLAMKSTLWVVAAVISLPFLTGVICNINVILMIFTEFAFPATSVLMRGRVRNWLHSMVLIVAILSFGLIFLSAAAAHLPSGIALTFLLLLTLCLAFIFWKSFIRLNSRIEYLFLKSFSTQTINEELQRRQKALEHLASRRPWDVSTATLHIPKHSFAVGKRILDLDLRKQTGATIIGIARNRYIHYEPSPETPLFPDDKLIVLGDKKQIECAEAFLSQEAEQAAPEGSYSFDFAQVCLSVNSPLKNETLAGARIRQQFGVNVVGIQRGPERITTLRPEFILKANDVLLVVGSTHALKAFQESNG
ncbi:MAG: hypothetical protein A2Y14_02575 [Verrucomicrobia bacterium GWF2_51_19]|nr:MAG: hypothetical protein A2Y14_02575 [Verrucomicrobia bacterium GWF2_51_19]